MFLGKTLYSHSAYFHSGVEMGTGKFNPVGVALRWTGIPFTGDEEYCWSLHDIETGISAGLMGPCTWLLCRLNLPATYTSVLLLLSFAFINEFRSSNSCPSNYLFFEVSYGVLIGVSKKIQHRMFNMIILEMVH